MADERDLSDLADLSVEFDFEVSPPNSATAEALAADLQAIGHIVTKLRPDWVSSVVSYPEGRSDEGSNRVMRLVAKHGVEEAGSGVYVGPIEYLKGGNSSLPVITERPRGLERLRRWLTNAWRSITSRPR